MGFYLAATGIQNVNMDFLSFLDGFEASVISGRNSFVFVDPRPPKQQIIRYSSISDMKLSDCSHGPNCQVEVDIPKRVKGALPPKTDTSIGCSTIPSQGIPIVSSLDKGIMFSEELGLISACLTLCRQYKMSDKQLYCDNQVRSSCLSREKPWYCLRIFSFPLAYFGQDLSLSVNLLASLSLLKVHLIITFLNLNSLNQLIIRPRSCSPSGIYCSSFSISTSSCEAIITLTLTPCLEKGQIINTNCFS